MAEYRMMEKIKHRMCASCYGCAGCPINKLIRELPGDCVCSGVPRTNGIFYMYTAECEKAMLKWNAENPDIKLTEVEKLALQLYDKLRYTHIVRDGEGEERLKVFDEKPVKHSEYPIWTNSTLCGNQLDVPEMTGFNFVRWMDNEPWSIDKLLKLEVYDE